MTGSVKETAIEPKVHEARLETKIDSAGRILIPVYLRKALGAEFGQSVIVELLDGKLTIYKKEPDVL